MNEKDSTKGLNAGQICWPNINANLSFLLAF